MSPLAWASEAELEASQSGLPITAAVVKTTAGSIPAKSSGMSATKRLTGCLLLASAELVVDEDIV